MIYIELVTACERLAPEDASLPPSGDKLGDKSFSKEALKHLCRGKDAYRQVFLEHSSALQAEKSSRDPCRIDPDIEPHSYTDPDMSNYFFHGWQIGATIDDTELFVLTSSAHLSSAGSRLWYGR